MCRVQFSCCLEFTLLRFSPSGATNNPKPKRPKKPREVVSPGGEPFGPFLEITGVAREHVRGLALAPTVLKLLNPMSVSGNRANRGRFGFRFRVSP